MAITLNSYSVQGNKLTTVAVSALPSTSAGAKEKCTRLFYKSKDTYTTSYNTTDHSNITVSLALKCPLTCSGILPEVLGEHVPVLDGIFGDGAVVVCSTAPLQRYTLVTFVYHSNSTWGTGGT